LKKSYAKVSLMRLVVILENVVFKTLFNEMRQYCKNVCNSMNQCFSNDQCMTLQNCAWKKLIQSVR
jgi:hypothetical protein